MFRFLTRRRNRSSSAVLPPRAPDGQRIYAIGDIHGRYDLLLKLQQEIHADAAAQPDKVKTVVYLGDYIDRGPESRAVLERLSTRPLPHVASIHLMGNHEQSMLRFLEQPEAHAAWLVHGGLATLRAYGVSEPGGEAGRPLERLAHEFSLALPRHQRHFLEHLKLYHVLGDYLFVHAGIQLEIPLVQQNPDDLMWIREAFLQYQSPHAYCVVHGHTVTDEPEFRANRIGIDTGAFATGRLSCLILDGETRALLET